MSVKNTKVAFIRKSKMFTFDRVKKREVIYFVGII